MKTINLLHKYHNAPIPYLIMHQFATKCAYLRIFLLLSGAVWDFCPHCGIGRMDLLFPSEVKLPYIWPQTYICNVFSHWQRLCSDINTRCAWYTNFRGKSSMQQAFSIIFQSWHTVTNKSQDIIFGRSPCCYAAGRRLWCTYLMW